MFLCSLLEELCTKEENDKTGCDFNFGHECIFTWFNKVTMNFNSHFLYMLLQSQQTVAILKNKFYFLSKKWRLVICPCQAWMHRIRTKISGSIHNDVDIFPLVRIKNKLVFQKCKRANYTILDNLELCLDFFLSNFYSKPNSSSTVVFCDK